MQRNFPRTRNLILRINYVWYIHIAIFSLYFNATLATTWHMEGRGRLAGFVGSALPGIQIDRDRVDKTHVVI